MCLPFDCHATYFAHQFPGDLLRCRLGKPTLNEGRNLFANPRGGGEHARTASTKKKAANIDEALSDETTATDVASHRRNELSAAY